MLGVTVLAMPVVLPVARAGQVEILPRFVQLNLWVGEETSYTIRIHNYRGESFNMALYVTVAGTPLGGSSSDLTLNYPSPVTLGPGNAFVTVQLEVNSHAVPGTYTITHAVVRV